MIWSFAFVRVVWLSGEFVYWPAHFVSQAESTSATNESVLKVALDHGKASGIIKSHDRVVVCQKVGDSSVVKIIELDD
jgi:pyruvate kinase